MKRVLLLMLILLCMFGTATAFAESEPNDSMSSANTLYMGSNYGKLSTSLDKDWWTFTAPQDSNRKVSITPPAGKNYAISLYQVLSDGTISYVGGSAFGYVILYGKAFPSGTKYYLEVHSVDLASDPVNNYTLNVTYW